VTQTKIRRRRLAGYAALIVLTLLIFRIPAVQNVAAAALIEFVEITERVLRLPCALLNHGHCFSLDRFDPTCPQCM
jgi:hypothetical protein